MPSLSSTLRGARLYAEGHSEPLGDGGSHSEPEPSPDNSESDFVESGEESGNDSDADADTESSEGTARVRAKKGPRKKQSKKAQLSRMAGVAQLSPPPRLVFAPKDAPPGAAQKKKRTTFAAPTPAVMAALQLEANAATELTVLPTFRLRKAPTFEVFDEHFQRYCYENRVGFKVRDSRRRDSENITLQKRHDASVAAAEKAGRTSRHVLNLLPPEMEYFKRKYVCLHSAEAASAKGTGIRKHESTRNTGCPAVVHAKAVFDQKEGRWDVVSQHENTTHNHPINDTMFKSYMTDSTIRDPELLARTTAQISVGGNTREIREQISTALGSTFTTAQFNNFRNYRLGGGLAAVNLDGLVSMLSDFEGAQCVTIHDQDDVVVGIVTQTGVQRELFRRYGDSLVMDWTHNTNNLGFQLGSLVVTSSTGKGVPVVEFLTLSQDMAMMKTVLQFFVDANPSASDRVKSFVIDKDYKEWKVLTQLFPKASVVLCQFHVLKWFKRVVTNKRYKIPKHLRKTLLKLFRSLMYADTKFDFYDTKAKLESLLKPDKFPVFYKYMDERWFKCVGMWANYERGKVYTAGNTTTNRIESHWGHLKAGLGRKRRIDLCLEAIIKREVAVLRRELADLSTVASKQRVFASDHKFVRGLFRRLSPSRVKLVREQWVKYIARKDIYSVEPTTAASVYSVRASAYSDVAFSVSVGAEQCTCSCRFSTSHRLPCRHQFVVAHRVLHEEATSQQPLSEFPSASIPKRWDIVACTDLIPALERAIGQLQTVRVANLSTRDGPQAKASDDPVVPATRPRRVRYVKLQRREEGCVVVLTAIEKRNVVQSQCDRVIRRMMDLGTLAFRDASVKLDSVLEDFLLALEKPPTMVSSDGTTRCDTAVNDTTAGVASGDAVVSGGVAVSGSTASRGASMNSGVVAGGSIAEEDLIGAANGHSGSDDTVDNVSDESSEDGFDDRFDDGFDYEPDEEGSDEDASFAQRRYSFDSLDMRVLCDSQASSLHLAQSQEGTLLSQATQYESSSQASSFQFSQLPSLSSQTSSLHLSQLPSLSSQTSSLQLSQLQLSPQLSQSIQGGEGSPHTTPDALMPSPRSLLPVHQAVSELRPSPRFAPLSPRATEAYLDALIRDDDGVDVDGPGAALAIVGKLDSPMPGSPARAVATTPTTVDLPDTPSRNTRQKRRITYDGSDTANPPKRVRLVLGDERHVLSEAGVRSTIKHPQVPVLAGAKPPGVGVSPPLKLPRPRAGTPRENKQVASKRALIAVRGKIECPVAVPVFSALLLYTPLGDLVDVMEAYPTLSVGSSVESRLVNVTERAVRGAAEKIKYLLPVKILESLVAAVARQRNEDKQRGHHVRPGGEVQYFVRVNGLPDEINESTLMAMSSYNEVDVFRNRVAADLRWFETMKSLESPKKGKVTVPFLEDLAAQCASEVSGDDSDLEKMLVRVEELYKRSSLRTGLTVPVRDGVPRRTPAIDARHIVGRLAGDKWLNDSVVDFSLHHLAAMHTDVVVVDAVSYTDMRVPNAAMARTRIVVFPIHYPGHWCLLVVNFDWSGDDTASPTAPRPPASHVVFAYDPKQSADYQACLAESWKSVCAPLLQKWWDRDAEMGASDGVSGFDVLTARWQYVSSPRQHDGDSCGLFIIAVARSYMTEDFSVHDFDTLQKPQLRLMRLRILYLLLARSSATETEVEPSWIARVAEVFSTWRRSQT